MGVKWDLFVCVFYPLYFLLSSHAHPSSGPVPGPFIQFRHSLSVCPLFPHRLQLLGAHSRFSALLGLSELEG
uniref:Uncharacterized protein n=1 Tax=Meloidogyne enterolobii TaxID=390850 RepID=A0A6V7WKR9_MELEN|nr:unnamed protein product [Meloidogyne enterolobii]